MTNAEKCLKYCEIKQILDTCYENISNLEAIISDIEIRYPKEFKEYNDYYNSFIGKEWKKGDEKNAK